MRRRIEQVALGTLIVLVVVLAPVWYYALAWSAWRAIAWVASLFR